MARMNLKRRAHSFLSAALVLIPGLLTWAIMAETITSAPADLLGYYLAVDESETISELSPQTNY